MPLFDHFHAPLKQRRHWDTFHGRWAYAIADQLNGGLLGPGYIAEGLVTLGQVEVDVATQDEPDEDTTERLSASSAGAVALAAPVWAPGPPALEIRGEFPDEIKVVVFSEEARSLVGAIELVSPRNKDRPSARRAFAVKCLSYLQSKVGLIIIDVVTDRTANLHDHMADLLDDAPTFPNSPKIYAAAYRPHRHKRKNKIAVWPVELKLGKPLPELPLWLRDQDTPIRIDLESTNSEACEHCRIS